MGSEVVNLNRGLAVEVWDLMVRLFAASLALASKLSQSGFLDCIWTPAVIAIAPDARKAPTVEALDPYRNVCKSCCAKASCSLADASRYEVQDRFFACLYQPLSSDPWLFASQTARYLSLRPGAEKAYLRKLSPSMFRCDEMSLGSHLRSQTSADTSSCVSSATSITP